MVVVVVVVVVIVMVVVVSVVSVKCSGVLSVIISIFCPMKDFL